MKIKNANYFWFNNSSTIKLGNQNYIVDGVVFSQLWIYARKLAYYTLMHIFTLIFINALYNE